MKEKKKDESRITAASYIYQFYIEIQSLNDNYSQYLNVLLELENKYKDTDKATDEEKQVLTQVTQLVRFSVHKTFIQYNSIMKGLKKTVNEDVKTSYEDIKRTFIINREKLEEYVITMNAVLIEDVIKKLLETTQDLLNDLYSDKDD